MQSDGGRNGDEAEGKEKTWRANETTFRVIVSRFHFCPSLLADSRGVVFSNSVEKWTIARACSALLPQRCYHVRYQRAVTTCGTNAWLPHAVPNWLDARRTRATAKRNAGKHDRRERRVRVKRGRRKYRGWRRGRGRGRGRERSRDMRRTVVVVVVVVVVARRRSPCARRHEACDDFVCAPDPAVPIARACSALLVFALLVFALLVFAFVFEGPDGQFVKALKYWNDDHNGSFPDVCYMNLGAWFANGETHSTTTSDVTTLVERLMKKYESSKFVYGSMIFFRDGARNMFDTAMYKMALLKHYQMTESRLHLFDRAIFSKIMFDNVKLERDSGHAPLILNLFDAQRLAQLILSIFQVPIVKPYIPHSFNNCSIRLKNKIL